jgi:DNA-binding CsgD family transcriptional regulator
MKPTTMDARSERMLQLLSEGASARILAKKLGYSEGTMRVYLHNLYKAIGVGNKTQAVIWHLGRMRTRDVPAASPPPMAHARADFSLSTFGDMALAEDLYTALGAMGSFLGPYGHLWEAGLRLKGTPLDERMAARRAQSRDLWRALLKGDFGRAKALHDEGAAERWLAEAPSDAMLLDCMLLIGGYSAAAERLLVRLSDKRRNGAGIAPREAALLRALRAALDAGNAAGVAELHGLAAESSRAPATRQLAMVALFYAFKVRRDLDRARGTANALWAEAEAARRQLEAMGVRPLGSDASLPRLGRNGTKHAVPAREKAAVAR